MHQINKISEFYAKELDDSVKKNLQNHLEIFSFLVAHCAQHRGDIKNILKC